MIKKWIEIMVNYLSLNSTSNTTTKNLICSLQQALYFSLILMEANVKSYLTYRPFAVEYFGKLLNFT